MSEHQVIKVTDIKEVKLINIPEELKTCGTHCDGPIENKESTAKEMLEKLGYRECYTGSCLMIRYYLNDVEEIQFDSTNKTIRKYNPFQDMPADISIKELKAINKQVEELGW